MVPEKMQKVLNKPMFKINEADGDTKIEFHTPH